MEWESWDFSRLMEPVAPFIAGSDIALCNMETAMVPRDQGTLGLPNLWDAT